MIIAIDGTMGSGKGTLARRLATHYKLPHLDTGLLYRAVAHKALQDGIDLSKEQALADIAASLDIWQYYDLPLRTQEISNAASVVSAHPMVRQALFDFQQDFCSLERGGNAVMDGRDIGTVICPHADFKLWLDAVPEVRARRRWDELQESGHNIPYQEVLAQLQERDNRDATRPNAPMRVSEGAIEIDTSIMTSDQVFKRAVAMIEERR